MLERLADLKKRYDYLAEELAKPETVKDNDRFRELSKEYNALAPIIETYTELLAISAQLEECSELLESETDSEMTALLHDEQSDLREKLTKLTEDIKVLLLPKDENDDKNVIVEIRAGIGGDEAALFGADLLRMYMRYAERHRFTATLIDESYTEIGGVKEVSLSIKGKGAYARLKFENGVHRVQRVPETESQGRIHTSAATVAVLSEASDIDIDINPSDLRVDTYRSSGAGGQHVNKTESAIRITHLPTGIVVQCQNERSQIKNRETAMHFLKTKLYDYEKSKRDAQVASDRKSQVGSGDRSERIRTYNFPQGRVTDHRINLTLYRLESFLDGDIDEMIDALTIKRRMDLLEGEE